MHYFEQTNPEYPRFGAGSTSDNHAEWIVDLTTKVASCHLKASQPEQFFMALLSFWLESSQSIVNLLLVFGGTSTNIARQDRQCYLSLC